MIEDEERAACGSAFEILPEDARVSVFCVGSRLMLDDGLGPAVYDELTAVYEFPERVQLFDVGCMSLDLVNYVDSSDFIITVDALDNTGHDPGTVFSFSPEDMARHAGATASLHDLKLIDLFDAASLLGYSCEGVCLGMQAGNISPRELTVGLTPKVFDALPLLVDAVLAQLVRRGVPVRVKGTGDLVKPGWHHSMTSVD